MRLKILLATLVTLFAWSPRLRIVTSSLPNGTVGVAYSATVQARFGTLPYTWSVASGALPPGLSLAASTGVISGTPTVASLLGSYSFAIKVTDVKGFKATVSYKVTIATSATGAAPTITTAIPTQGQVGSTFTVQGTNYVSGAIVALGATSCSTTYISPTQLSVVVPAIALATYNVKVTNPDAQNVTLTNGFKVVAPPLSITTISLPNGTANVAYSATVSGTGGVPPYTWSISAGSLPTGLVLDGTSGVVSGTPTVAGTYNFTIKITDAQPVTAIQAYSVVIAIPGGPSIGSVSPSSGTLGSTVVVNGSGFVNGAVNSFQASTGTSVVATDNFNRADGGLGANWTTITGFCGPVVSSNRVLGGCTGDGGAYWTANVFTSDQYSKFTALAASAADGNTAVSAVVRGSGSSFYVFTVNGTSNSGIKKVTSGGTVALATGVVSASIGDVFEFDAQGSTLKALKNGVLLLTATDTSLTTGSAGIYIYNNTPSSAIDNWEGGNLGAVSSNATTVFISSTQLTAVVPSALSTGSVYSTKVTNPDTSNATLPNAFTVTSPALTVTTASLPNGVVNQAYSVTASVVGGTPPYTWSVISGSLPVGLSLNSSTGVISGTPINAATYTFTLQVVDSGSPLQVAQQSYTVNIASAPSITTSSLPGGIIGTVYSSTLQAIGGVSPYTWSVVSGALPVGLSLNASSGAITGTPTTSGNFSFLIQLSDSSSPQQTAQKSFSVAISVNLSVATSSLPNGTIGVSYSATLQASGGTAPYTWSIVLGTLPTGLSLNASTGIISGTPTATGTSNITVKVLDSGGPQQLAQKALSIVVNSAVLVVTTTSLSNGQVGVLYSQQLQASGGVPPYTWAVASGSLPANVSLATVSGIVSGTPTVAATSSFVPRVTDSASTSALGSSLSITIASGSTAFSARTDLTAAPETVPVLCSPAPCTFTSSDLNSNILYTRVTDASTRPGGEQWGTANSIDNAWSIDQTTFALDGFTAGMTAFKFNMVTQLASPMPCSYSGFGTLGCVGGIFIPGQFFNTADSSYSWVTPNVIYGFNGNLLQKLDFRPTYAAAGVDPILSTLADMSACAGIPVPGSFSSIVTVRSDDTRISSVTGGSQDNAKVVYVWDTVQAGCRFIRTDTMQIGGAWGPTGAVICHAPDQSVVACLNFSDLHGSQMSRDGRWAVFSRGPTNNDYWWDITTLNIYDQGDGAGSGGSCFQGGHEAIGFNNIVISPGGSGSLHQKQIAPAFGAGSCTLITPTQPPGFAFSQDSHDTWKNQTVDTTPLISAFFGFVAPTTAWQDEIIANALDGSNTVWRFAHTYTRGHDFNAQQLPSVSHDGKWVLFGSDWTTLRDDVFLIKLQ